MLVRCLFAVCLMSSLAGCAKDPSKEVPAATIEPSEPAAPLPAAATPQ